MSRIKIINIVVVVALLLAGLTWYLYHSFSKTTGNPWEMIPDNAALIIEIDKPADLYNKLGEGNSILESLMEVRDVKILNSKITWLNNFLSDKNDYSHLLWNSPLTIAFYSDTVVNVETLILSKVERNIDLASIKSMLTTNLGREYAILDILGVTDGFKIVSSNDNKTGYFTFIDGVFAYSSSTDLLITIIPMNRIIHHIV